MNHVKNKNAYIPIGTLEWHGNHLPIETDFLVARRICEILSEKIPGYVLPPIYLGSGTKKKINGRWLIGMDKFLKKKLPGSLYYLDSEFFARVLVNLGKNLKIQGFEKIFIITWSCWLRADDGSETRQKKIEESDDYKSL